MSYRFTLRDNSGLLAVDLTSEQAAAIIEPYKGNPNDTFVVTGSLPVSVEAKVTRRNGKEFVEVEGDSVKFTVLRLGATQPEGELSVSCSPVGNCVPVITFNFPFRDYQDPYTDRGIVWVWVNPGQPATLQLNIVATSEFKKGLVQEIIDEAVNTVERRLLSRFQRV